MTRYSKLANLAGLVLLILALGLPTARESMSGVWAGEPAVCCCDHSDTLEAPCHCCAEADASPDAPCSCPQDDSEGPALAPATEIELFLAAPVAIPFALPQLAMRPTQSPDHGRHRQATGPPTHLRHCVWLI